MLENLKVAEAIMGCLAFVCTALALYVSLTLKASLASHRASVVKQFSEFEERLKEWINGSFLRAKVVEAQMEAQEQVFAARIETVKAMIRGQNSLS